MNDDEKKQMKERRGVIYALAIVAYVGGILITHALVKPSRPLEWTPILIGTPIGVAIAALVVAIAKKLRRTRSRARSALGIWAVLE